MRINLISLTKHHYRKQNSIPSSNPLFIAYTRFCSYSCLFYKTKHQQFKFLRVSSKVLLSVGSPQLSIQNTNQEKEFCRFNEKAGRTCFECLGVIVSLKSTTSIMKSFFTCIFSFTRT